eukprot:jgi/Mesen1/8384/ME000468S07821
MAHAVGLTFKSPVVDTIQALPHQQQLVLCSAVRMFGSCSSGKKKDATIAEVSFRKPRQLLVLSLSSYSLVFLFLCLSPPPSLPLSFSPSFSHALISRSCSRAPPAAPVLLRNTTPCRTRYLLASFLFSEHRSERDVLPCSHTGPFSSSLCVPAASYR